MNKKLVALAVAGVFALPVAAQAQTANVTLYGRLNVDMEFLMGDIPSGTGTTDPTVYRLSTNSSRFGIRGSESLGGGLSAIFQIENSVGGDASGGTIAGRETFVGLQGSWGTFKMGRFLAPYDDIHPIFGNNPTLTTSILATAALWANAPAGQPERGGFDDRVQNSVRYDSPNIAGFTGSLQYGTYECSPSCSSHAGVISLGGFYSQGPFQAGVAYENHKDVRADGLTDQGISVAAAYNFGIVRVAGVYERLQYDVVGAGDLKRDLYGGSLTIPAGPGTVFASWIHANDGKGGISSGPSRTRIGNITAGGDTGADHFTLSYTYPMSKRTLLYTGVTYIDNESNGNATFNINPYPNMSGACFVGQPSAQGNTCSGMANGGDPLGFVFGMVHFF